MLTSTYSSVCELHGPDLEKTGWILLVRGKPLLEITVLEKLKSLNSFKSKCLSPITSRASL